MLELVFVLRRLLLKLPAVGDEGVAIVPMVVFKLNVNA